MVWVSGTGNCNILQFMKFSCGTMNVIKRNERYCLKLHLKNFWEKLIGCSKEGNRWPGE